MRGAAPRPSRDKGRSRTDRPRAKKRRRLLLGLICLLTALPPFSWPVRGGITSRYFLRFKPDAGIIPVLEFHDGIDIAAPTGSGVRATAPGIVAEAGYSEASGNFVRVRHALGFSSYYAHLSRIYVREGNLVLLPALTWLGAVGATGRATGPHLHFELKLGSASLPPRPFLAAHSLRRFLLGL